MSDQRAMRRTDKVMPEAETLDLLERALVARVAVVEPDGEPYLVPMLYVWFDGKFWFHRTQADGRFAAALRASPRVCIEVDQCGPVFTMKPSDACAATIAYESAMAGGVMEPASPEDALRFSNLLMSKYAGFAPDGPPPHFPMQERTRFYSVRPEWLTGKRTVMPADAHRFGLE